QGEEVEGEFLILKEFLQWLVVEYRLVDHSAEEEPDEGEHDGTSGCEEHPFQSAFLPAYLLVEISEIEGVEGGEDKGIEKEESQQLRIQESSQTDTAEDQVDEEHQHPDHQR